MTPAGIADGLTASYAPGGWVAIAGTRTWVLIDLDPAASEVAALWALLCKGADHRDAIDVLTPLGVRGLPSFAMISLDGEAATIIVRGTGVARLTTAGGPLDVSAATVTTWREYTAESPRDVLLLAGGDCGSGTLALPAGLVPASSLGLCFEMNAGAGAAQPDAAETGATRAAPIRPEVEVSADEVDDPVSATDAEPDPDSPGRPDQTDDEAIARSPIFVAGAVESVPDPFEDAAFPFGEAPTQSIEPASRWEQPPPRPAAPEGTSDPAPSTQESIADPPSTHDASVLIDRVPWALSPEPPPPPPPPEESAPEGPAAMADDSMSGLTISREVHGDPHMAGASRLPLPSARDVVQAVRCPRGHPSPPGSATCRVCAALLASQPAYPIPRPVLGVLRMSTGDVVTLDRGVLMGRSPSPGYLVADERPHVVKLPSPDTEISRNHLEVRLDGWRVLVSDLNSTNGTLVTAPGEAPQQLTPGAPTEITPGTTVALSDQVSFRFETTQ